MANCIYVLHGRTFNSELELDNFLMNNKNSIRANKVSDIVFSVKHTQNEVCQILEDKRVEAERINLLAEIRRAKGYMNFEDEKLIGDYMGVNRFMLEFRGPNDKRLIPKYIEEKLKQSLYAKWSTDGFDDHYAKLLGRNVGEKITDLQVFDYIFDLLKTSWESLGATGSTIHEVLALMWAEKNETTGRPYTDEEILQKVQYFPLDIINAFRGIHNAIKSSITSKPGFQNAKFYAEYPVIGETCVTNKSTGNNYKLLGIVDLLVVDDNGKVHIFDYKTSDRPFDEWYSAKRIGYCYQLLSYKLMIDSYGLDTSGGELGIIPLLIDNFVPNNSNNKVGQFTGLVLGVSGIVKSYLSIANPNNPIMNNLLNIIIYKEEVPPISNDFLLNLQTLMLQLFPSYRFQLDVDEAVIEELKKDLMLNEQTGKWERKRKRNSGQNEFDSVEDYYKYIKEMNDKSFSYYKSLIQRAMETGDASILSQEESKSILDRDAQSREWFLNLFSQFCTGNGEWEMLDVPEFDAINMIVMHNRVGGYYKVFMVDNVDLRIKVPFKKGTSVLGNFVDDITPLQIANVTPLEGTYGNINNMKAMLALNLFPEIIKPGEQIEGIYTICPSKQLGYHANAHQLEGNFRELCSYGGVKNNFGTKLKFLPAHLAAIQLIREYSVQMKEGCGLNKVYSLYESNIFTLENTLNNLLKIKQALEEEYPDFTQYTEKGPKIDFNTPLGRAYGKVMLAISELQGGFYSLTLRDGSKIRHYIDNPEMLERNLRNIYRLTTNTFEEFKRNMNNFVAELREQQIKLWKAKGYSVGRRNLLNDERVLYLNMFKQNTNKSGLFTFKDPWDQNESLEPEEREFLKFVIIKMAKLRNPNLSDAEILTMRADPESGIFDVPLLMKKSSKNILTKNGRKGLVSWFKKQLRWFLNPQGEYSYQGFKDNLKMGISDALNSNEAKEAERNFSKNVFQAFDIFEASENPVKREELLRVNDIDVFEDDLGKILYIYAGAKLKKRSLDNYMPLLSALLVLNMFEAATNNISIDKNVDYILKYTRAKILNMSIVPEEFRPLAKLLEKTRVLTAYGTLGMSLKSGLFLIMEGVWKNASRAGIKPLGKNLFGRKELSEAVGWLMGDAPNHLKLLSMGQLLNEAYAINDMDVSRFAKLLHDGQFPLEFSSKLMWMTSSPDYLNRMAIFIAQMKKDGCFDAHEMKGTRLIYNWKKDKRFDLFVQGEAGKRKNAKEFNKQKALYKAMMSLFQKENYMITDENGNLRPLLFDPLSDKPGDDIPQAYTNLLARNIKSFCDQLYGYYNHEDQFLLKSLLLGASYAQFRVYWSSLKNRWWLKGDVYSNGEFKQMVNKDGLPLYVRHIYDEYGNKIGEEITTDETDDPYFNWSGHYQEGILQTLGAALKTIFDPHAEESLSKRSIRVIHGEMLGNINEDVVAQRLSNLKIFIHDLAIWALVGLLIGTLLTKYLKQLEKEDKYKNLSFLDKTVRTFESVGAASLIASVQDLGMLKDITSPLTDWTPPSFRYTTNVVKDVGNWITGDKDFSKVLIENITAIRQSKNYWYKAERALSE